MLGKVDKALKPMIIKLIWLVLNLSLSISCPTLNFHGT